MAYSKLPFVKGTPLLAKVRKFPGDPTPDIWSAGAGDMTSWRFSNTRYTLNGLTYGEEGTVPGGPGGGDITAPLIISAQDMQVDANTGYEQISKTNFSGGSGGMYDLQINDAAAIIAGAVLNFGESPSMPLYSITGGNNYYGIDYGIPGDDLSTLKTKLINILNAANAPGQPLNGRLSIISPSGDNLPNWVQIHLEQGVGQSVFIQQGSTGYNVAVAPLETQFNPGSDPFVDLRINNAQEIIDGGILIVGTDPGGTELMRIMGGNTYYGIDYGVAGDTLSTLKTKLVDIINFATAPGEPLAGLGIFASPSGDNLPNWVQIHVSGDSTNLFFQSFRYDYYLGVLPSMEEVNVNFGGDKNVYVVLARITLVAPGAINIVNKRIVLVAEAPHNVGGYIDEVDAVYNKVQSINIFGLPGVHPTIHSTDAVLLAFTPPSGATGDRYVGYFRDNFSSDTGSWNNEFYGTGFGVDITDEEKSSHSNSSYTPGVEGFAGSFARAVYGDDQTLPEQGWEAEFDYDVSNTIPVFDGSGGPPNCPMALYAPMNLEGLGTMNPLFQGLSIAALVVKGTDGTYCMGFDYSGDGPATGQYTVNDTGRIRIVHDGLGGYEWFISYNNGTSWTSMFSTSGVTLPTGYESVNKRFRFGCACFGLGNTPDVRMDNVIFRRWKTGVNLYNPLIDINQDMNYIIDMVGFTNGIHSFTGIVFDTAEVVPISGNFGPVVAGSIKAGLANFNGHDTRIIEFPSAYYPFDGTQNVAALAVSIDSLPVYLTFLVPVGDVAAATADFLAHGATLVDVIQNDIFLFNGLNTDYTWNFGGGPIPPAPAPSRNFSEDVNGIDEELKTDVYDIQY